MNNEPVAWMLTDRVVSSVPIEGAIPLYTHPTKTLTDDDLVECIEGHIPLGIIEEYGWVRIYEFARAILRKAQEK